MGICIGLLGFPRKGTGARKGESVSKSILSIGNHFTTARKSSAFLKVTIPFIPIYQPISTSLRAILNELVKLCATPSDLTGISLRIFIVSTSASRLCITTGSLSSSASMSCLRNTCCCISTGLYK